MIKELKYWLLKDEIEMFKKAVNECYAQVELWREKAHSAEREVMEARQVARYWRGKAEKAPSVDDMFPWEVRVKLNRARQAEQDASLCRRYEQREAWGRGK